MNTQTKELTPETATCKAPTLREAAAHLEALGLQCLSCGAVIRGSWWKAYPHPNGATLADRKGRWWIFAECPGCGYQSSLTKLTHRMPQT